MNPRPLAKLTHQVGRRAVDLTNETVGTFTVIELTDRRHPGDSSKVWKMRCSCGAERFMSVAKIRQAQREGSRPRCDCPAWRHGLTQRERPEFESKRPSTAHPSRRPGKFDCPCAGLPHRVPRNRTCSCGNTYAPEPAVRLDLTGLGSSAGQLERFAPEGLNGFRAKRGRAA